MNTGFTEHQLPSNQTSIYTNDVKRLIMQANVLKSTEGSPASIGLVVGASGTGKTIAAHAYWTTMEQEQRASCAIVDVMPQITAKELLSAILHHVGEHARPRTSHDALRQTIDALQQKRMRLFIFDQSDYLERSTLEALSLLIEKTPCSFLLLGLPDLPARLRVVPSFASRIGLKLQFGPLPEEEIYEVFLPQLVLPGWAFDPKSQEDLRLGRYLWNYARPSLRRVCTILGYASYLVQMSNSRNIAFEDVRTAIRMTYLPHEWEMREESEPSSLHKTLTKRSKKGPAKGAVKAKDYVGMARFLQDGETQEM